MYRNLHLSTEKQGVFIIVENVHPVYLFPIAPIFEDFVMENIRRCSSYIFDI